MKKDCAYKFFLLLPALSLIIYAPAARANDVLFRGYTTSTYTGSGVGGLKGAHAKCNTDFPGSRAMNYNDLMNLGSDYTAAQAAWLIDGSFIYWNGSGPTMYQTVKGGDQSGTPGTSANTVTESSCAQWTNAGGTRAGPYVTQTQAYIYITGCSSSLRLACVQD